MHLLIVCFFSAICRRCRTQLKSEMDSNRLIDDVGQDDQNVQETPIEAAEIFHVRFYNTSFSFLMF